MIARVLEALAGRVSAADAVEKVDDTLSLAISTEGESRVTAVRAQTTQLRVVRDGRVGYATATDDDPGELAGRAIAAAASGGELELLLPAPAPLPAVECRSPQAAAAEVDALDHLARALFERLTRSSRRVEVWAERSSGTVHVANTRGVLAGYEVTLAGIGAVVESIGAGWAPPCRVHAAGVALPTLQDVEALVTLVERRLAPPLIDPPRPLPPALPVCFAPRAAAAFLRPLRAALLGRPAEPGRMSLQDRLGEPVFDERVSVSDDPLASGRPGTRPVDDDGVPSRRVPLVERGRLVGLLADLETGARSQMPSTGSGWRTPFAGSRVGFANLRIAPGVEGRATLLTMMGRGLLIEDFDWGAGPNPLGGQVVCRVPWAYLVESGTIRGRLEGVVLSGNALEALRRVGAVGSDAAWSGSASVPSLLVEGLAVAIRS